MVGQEEDLESVSSATTNLKVIKKIMPKYKLHLNNLNQATQKNEYSRNNECLKDQYFESRNYIICDHALLASTIFSLE